MSRVVVITDSHFGARNDSLTFGKYFERFYSEVFFPYLDSSGIQHVLHLGDLVDRRKYINFYTGSRMVDTFLDPLCSRRLDVTFIAGNHDTFFKNTNEINAYRLLVKDRYPFRFFEDATHLDIGGTEICLVPWITDENKQQTFDTIRNSRSSVCMGHLELAGFEYSRGQVADHGLDVKTFDRFDLVGSGHYHHRSSRGNVHYLGSPYEMTWSDYSDPKGFHVFDTDTRELEFIENPHTIFRKFFYDDSTEIDLATLSDEIEQFRECNVKIVVKNKENPYIFDTVIGAFEKVTTEIQVVDDHLNLDRDLEIEVDDNTEETRDILNSYVEKINVSVDKSKLLNYVHDLHHRAQNLDV